MNIIHSIILGAIEGITEFLPISSTAHLIIGSQILGLTQTEFVKSFEIVIQLGAILAVVWVYRNRLLQSKTLWLKILAAFIPTAIIGFLLYEIIKGFLFEANLVIALALIIGGVVLIFFERFLPQPIESTIETLSYPRALVIGLAQSLAVIPGVSRAAATIISSRFVGLSAKESIEFSFLLAIPTIAAASGYDLLKSNLAFSGNEYVLLAIGFISSFFFAMISIKWLLNYINTHDFKGFGIYRIILGLLFLLFIL